MRTIGIIIALCLIAVLIWHLSQRNRQRGAVPSIAKQDFRIDARALDDQDASLAWDVIEPIWMLPTGTNDDDKLPPEWASVTDEQLAVYAVTWVEREVINGGFWQYLYNASADLPIKALDGFQKMGATEYAKLLERAISLFPGGELPKTRNERMRFLPDDPYEDVPDQDRAMLDELGKLDDRFYDLYGEGEQFYQYIGDYIRGHPNQFFK